MTRIRAEKIAKSLSPAQRLVLKEMLRGNSAREIGEALEISPFTVNNHGRAIHKAFGATSRAQVISYFVVPPKGL